MTGQQFDLSLASEDLKPMAGRHTNPCPERESQGDDYDR
jgi:hypothetical protein